jgi:prepilin-type N-terminal cleavage/methylation domain-containing protein
MKIPNQKPRFGFTLVEMMMSIACGSLILAAVVAAGVSLQRSFAAVEGYSVSQGDQLRVQDYIAMDCRRAIRDNSIAGLPNDGVTTDGYTPAVDTGSWVGGSWSHSASGPATLILALPNYYDANGNPQAPQYNSGKITYGGGVTAISYYQSGTSLMRQVGTNSSQCLSGSSWNNCAKAIATNIYNFAVTPPTQQIINKDTVTYTITFSPTFTTNPYAASNANVVGTTIYANTFLRNPDSRRYINAYY